MAIPIRIGNDLKIKWHFYKNEQKESLPLNEEVPTTVYLKNNTSRWPLEVVDTTGDYYEIAIPGRDQVTKYGSGMYSLTCVEEYGSGQEKGRCEVDLLECLLFLSNSDVIMPDGVFDEDGYLNFESIVPTWYVGEQNSGE